MFNQYSLMEYFNQKQFSKNYLQEIKIVNDIGMNKYITILGVNKNTQEVFFVINHNGTNNTMHTLSFIKNDIYLDDIDITKNRFISIENRVYTTKMIKNIISHAYNFLYK